MGFTQEKIGATVRQQRAFFRTGKTLGVEWRVAQLKKLKQAVIDHTEELQKALYEDLGKSPVEAYLVDIGPVIVEINEILRGIKKWAKPERHFSGLMCFPSVGTTVYKMPYGVSLIISPFNFPVLLTLGVLAASIAGGNTAVIKASSKSAASTRALQRLIADTFPEKYAVVIDGGHDVADMCLAERIVRRDADLRDAARKIAFFKICNAGQICININQIAVAQEVAKDFLRELKREFIRQIGEQAEKNPDYPKLITDAVYEKCVRLTDEYRAKVVFGGTGDSETRRFSPTVLYPIDADDDIVQHELFCPILPVVPFKDAEIDDLMKLIAEREHPLAMYVFTSDMRWANAVMSTQQFGGGCINEVCVHMMVKGVPFNGTGHSGMGAYHGEWGFREFTHPTTVLKGSTRFNLPLREHPYSGRAAKAKMALLRLFER